MGGIPRAPPENEGVSKEIGIWGGLKASNLNTHGGNEVAQVANILLFFRDLHWALWLVASENLAEFMGILGVNWPLTLVFLYVWQAKIC